MTALLDNSVIDKIYPTLKDSNVGLVITARTDNDNPEYREKHPKLGVIPNVARFGHSIWDGGEVWGNKETAELSNQLLAMAANQSSISKPGDQTSHNQRDDADIITAAVINECEYLVSDDKKFMLRSDVRSLVENHGVQIVSSDEFLKKVWVTT